MAIAFLINEERCSRVYRSSRAIKRRKNGIAKNGYNEGHEKRIQHDPTRSQWVDQYMKDRMSWNHLKIMSPWFFFWSLNVFYRCLLSKKEYRNSLRHYCSFVDRYVCIYKTTQARGTKPENRNCWSRSSRFPWEMQFIVTALFLLSLHMASSSHRKERERERKRERESESYFKSGSLYAIVMLYFSIIQKYDLYLL